MPFRVATRLAASFAGVIVIAGTSCALAFGILSNAEDGTANDAAAVLSLGNELRTRVADIGRVQAQMLLVDGKTALILGTTVEPKKADVQAKTERIRGLMISEEGRRAVEGFSAAWSGYLALHENSRRRSASSAIVLSRTRSSQAFAYAEAAMRGVIDSLERAGEGGAVELGERAVQDMLRIQRLEKDALLETGEPEAGQFARQAEQAERELQAKLIKLDRALAAFDRAAIHGFRDAWRTYLNVNREVRLAAADAPRPPSAGDELSAYEAVDKALDAMLAAARSWMSQEVAAAETRRRSAWTTTVDLLVAALGLGILIAGWSIVSISRRFSRMNGRADEDARQADVLALDQAIETARDSGISFAAAAAQLRSLATARQPADVIPLRPEIQRSHGLADNSRA